MRRSRRGSHSPLEFGGSGEDSFVAVVVTKLTGALLFILLLAMVIMALLPKADLPVGQARSGATELPLLSIRTPARLPEAISGRPYDLALAAEGGQGKLVWRLDGVLPAGLAFDETTATLKGRPEKGTPEPLLLVARVSDGHATAQRTLQLSVFEPDRTLSLPASWQKSLSMLPWRTWFEQGFGFLLLLLIHQVGMNSINGLERRSAAVGHGGTVTRSRYSWLRMALRASTLASVGGLCWWLWARSTLGR